MINPKNIKIGDKLVLPVHMDHGTEDIECTVVYTKYPYFYRVECHPNESKPENKFYESFAYYGLLK